MRYLFSLMLTFFTWSVTAQSAAVYQVQSSELTFHSDAPKELITAAATTMKGLLDIDKRTFVFKLAVAGFKGFNNQLQQEHFRENYMETHIYPEAVYNGKIIEDVDLRKPGVYNVRTKGRLTIHGVEQERIIRSTITVRDNTILVAAAFSVALRDHQIKVPRVVYEKLAADISVTMNAVLIPKTLR